MKRRTFLISATAATLAAPSIVRAQSKTKLTMGQANDPALIAPLWAAANNKVTSDLVEIDFSYVSIPAVIQAIMTQQYDLAPCVTQAMPKLAARGLPVKAISAGFRYSEGGGGSRLWVMADGAASPKELKGGKIGVSSLSSGGVTNNRIMMAEVYGLDVSIDGGDFTWLEIPPGTLPTALQSGQIDAAVLSNSQDYAASENDDMRPLFDVNGEMRKFFDVQVPGIMTVGFESKLNERPEEFKAADELLLASRNYMLENRDEVFGAVAEEQGSDTAYLDWYYSKYADAGYDLLQSDLVAMDAYWAALKKLGELDSYPDPKTLIWEQATFE